MRGRDYAEGGAAEFPGQHHGRPALDDAADVDDGADVIADAARGQPGGWWFGFALVGGAALLAAGVVGYLIGNRQPKSPRAQTVQPTNATGAADPAVWVRTTNNRCSAQVGELLQLGAEFRNAGPSLVRLLRVEPVNPLLGLQPIKTERGTCGQPADGDVSDYALDPGTSVWITTTVEVPAGCPWGLLIPFDVTYTTAAREVHTEMSPFATLTGVPFSGCARLRDLERK
jgi:hypothetical protein